MEEGCLAEAIYVHLKGENGDNLNSKSWWMRVESFQSLQELSCFGERMKSWHGCSSPRLWRLALVEQRMDILELREKDRVVLGRPVNEHHSQGGRGLAWTITTFIRWTLNYEYLQMIYKKKCIRWEVAAKLCQRTPVSKTTQAHFH